jgi:dihydrofolate synthase / folylpolyglutamate synthase
MTYTETIDYLYSRLPVFHRIGPKALKPGLSNTIHLCAAVGNPHEKFRSIHVAGTNGKGSTSHMLASIYQEAGLRVGLYTSPHLKSFTERIRLNGQPIPEAEVVQFVEQTKAIVDEVEPSFFELTVAMAFDYFARQQVDLAIIEVGLGGRLDSTNIITPLVSVITNIGYDHMDILGDTLPLIAAEKAGIIKPGIPVVVGEYLPETRPVFDTIAAQQKAPLYYASDRFSVSNLGLQNEQRQVAITDQNAPEKPPLFWSLELPGIYQLRNLPAILETVDLLQHRFPVSVQAMGEGLAKTVQTTGLQGRFQTIQSKPRVILDTAHNEAGIRALMETIATIPHTVLRVVIGLVADKNPQPLLDQLPRSAVYYLCKADSPRSMPVDQLAQNFQDNQLTVSLFNNVNNALQQAVHDAKSTELIIVTGSTYVVSEVNNLTL